MLLSGRTVAPLIQVTAFYVISHGHYSPGGGFQGGVLLAASFLLLRLTYGVETGRLQLGTDRASLWSAAGTFGYVGVGLLALGLGGEMLDYGALGGLFPWVEASPERLRFQGILVIEVAVGIAVAAALVSIYDDLLTGGADAA